MDSLIFASEVGSASIQRTATLAEMIDEADTALYWTPLAFPDSPSCSYLRTLENILKKANNNLNFVLPLEAD